MPSAPRFALAMLVVASTAMPVQARDTAMINPVPVALAGGQAQPAAQARQAMLEAATTRGWTVVDDKPGELVLRFNKANKHSATVAARYDASGMQIHYVDSVNLNQKVKDGFAVIHPTYNIWVADLARGAAALYGRSGVPPTAAPPAASAAR